MCLAHRFKRVYLGGFAKSLTGLRGPLAFVSPHIEHDLGATSAGSHSQQQRVFPIGRVVVVVFTPCAPRDEMPEALLRALAKNEIQCDPGNSVFESHF